MKNEHLLLSPVEFARAMAVSKSWVYSKLKTGELPKVTLPGGRLVRIPADWLVKFTESANA